ncbi:Histone-lysine N-methyltransferase set9 [Aspergillus nanangensis]|uniref:Histone-lysine N-methyltransferase SET9 n=1 Tax=Aspergillus nanangensis TaxID=2582783 RepID=A0AAD4CHH2_ASPNN|nr:Histone-lysine N-methyltransferase set9 [Aspergillus nanangensis]
MSATKARSTPPNGRAARLTLAKLASYDDVATDALVDRAYFWTNTRKNRTKYIPVRGILDDKVAEILLHHAIVTKDPVQTERELLAISGLKKYLAKLPDDREKDWFRRHLRKYIHMYLPDSPFEVTTTNRYTITEHEAAICARKFIKQGQEIKYLSGTLVPMTREEEQDLDLKRKDFSIVMSSRRKTPSFFLGPARFANHDCNANGRLVTRGSEGMQVMATRDIYIGEEITVSYGDDYFGIDNCECLCMTCERAVRNGWAPQVESEASSPASTPALHDDVAPVIDGPGSPKKRTLGLDADSDSSPCSTPPKRRKFSHQNSKLRTEVSLSEVSVLLEPVLVGPAAEASNESAMLAPSLPVKGGPVGEDDAPEDSEQIPEVQPSVCARGSPSSPEADESQSSSTSTAPTSLCDVRIKVEESIELSAAAPGTSEPTDDSPIEPDQRLVVRGNEVLSGLSESLELDEKTDTVIARTKRRRSRREVVPSVEEETTRVRVPGDYTKTSKLLAQAYDRWVDCRTCNVWFIQHNGYLTRRECPRCERHSMLYGFQWPKTERDGPMDDEERVMDHRTVHRFLYPDEEARISRRDRGISFGVTPTPELSEARTETDSEMCDDRRNTRASRRRTHSLRMAM